ncbi:MAG TPA: cation acetate symporter, partial [Enteractinococcus sp.]
MRYDSLLVLGSIGVVCIVTIIISVHGLRRTRTTRDFYVASRRVPPWMNASAIAGEYLSAASFLGVAGLIMAYGTHGLWFPVGYTAGFLSLLVFVAAPLRRSGAYTIPDLMSLRLPSRTLRRLTALLVVVTGWLYIIPQLHGAAIALSATTG